MPGRTRTLYRSEPTRNWSVLISFSWENNVAYVRSSEFGVTQATLHIVIEEYENQSSLCGSCGGQSGFGAGSFRST
jgi:hypothetical protein